MHSRVLLAACLLLAFLLPPALGAREAQVRDVARFEYDKGGELTGHIVGWCDATGFRLREARPATVLVNLTVGNLVVYETWRNGSWIEPDPDAPNLGPAVRQEQRPTVHELAPGPVEIRWVAGRGFLERRQPDANLQFNFDTRSLTTGPTEGEISFGAYPHDAGANRIFWIHLGLPGPTRLTQPDEPVLRGWGEFLLAMDEAEIRTADGWRLQLPAFHQIPSWTGADPSVSYRTDLWTHAILQGRASDIQVASAHADLACQDLHVDVEGGGVFHRASGWVQRGNETISFGQQELAGSGRFRLFENVTGETFERGSVTGEARGEFDAVGLDFAVVPLTPGPQLSAAEAAWLAVALAVATTFLTQFSRFIGIFYSRFDQHGAVRHPTRNHLLDIINQRPGLILGDLVVQTGRRYGVVRHHVRVLATLGLVKTLRTGKAVHVYPKNHSLSEARRKLVWERDEPVRFLVEAARASPVQRRWANRELQSRYGMSRMGAWKAVRRAVSSGLLREEATPDGEILAALPIGAPPV